LEFSLAPTARFFSKLTIYLRYETGCNAQSSHTLMSLLDVASEFVHLILTGIDDLADETNITRRNRQTLACNRIVVACGIPYKDNPRRCWILDPMIFVGKRIEWPNWTATPDHAGLRKAF